MNNQFKYFDLCFFLLAEIHPKYEKTRKLFQKQEKFEPLEDLKKQWGIKWPSLDFCNLGAHFGERKGNEAQAGC